MKKILQFLLLVLTCSIAAHSFGALTSQSLQYDDLNRLIGVDYGNGIAIQYNYDEASNVTLVTAQGNTPPQAVDSTVVTNEDTPVSATLSGSDADGDPLTFNIVTNGTIGSAVITNPATGVFTYTPNLNKVGTDAFTFRVSDGKQQSNLAKVTVTINAVESYVTVPNVSGMTQAQATTAINTAGLGVGIVTMANSSTVPLGAVISQNPTAGTTVLNTTLVSFSVSKGPAADTTEYENPSDGAKYGWSVFSGDPAGAKISNVYDGTLGRRVISLNGAGLNNGYLLQNADNTPWNDTNHRLLTWWMQFGEDFSIQVDVDTTAGHRYLVYDALDYDQLGTGSIVHHGLGPEARDGKWRVFARHLQEDLSEAQPGATITAVNGILIYGSGRIGEVNLTAGRIIKVPTEQPTIQAGIDMAYDGDVVLVAPGTYTGADNKNLALYGKQVLLLKLKKTGSGQANILV